MERIEPVSFSKRISLVKLIRQSLDLPNIVAKLRIFKTCDIQYLSVPVFPYAHQQLKSMRALRYTKHTQNDLPKK
jgi:hypothetical protein